MVVAEGLLLRETRVVEAEEALCLRRVEVEGWVLDLEGRRRDGLTGRRGGEGGKGRPACG